MESVEWDIKTVGQLFEVQLGKMLSKIAKDKYPHYKYLGNKNVRWNGFEVANLGEMHFSDREKKKFALKQGDILMCEGGEVGRCSIWNEDHDDVYYQKALHRLRSKGTISPFYFQQYMLLVSGTKLLEDFTSRTSIAHLTREKLIELPVKCPPLPEQRKIAKILQTWDRAIATTEKLIDASKQQKKALMQQLLTGKKRFAGECQTQNNCEKLGLVPAGWGYKKLGKVAELQRGFDLPSSRRTAGVFPIISSAGISGYHDEYKVEAPGVVTGRYGSIGNVYFVSEKFWPLNTALWVKDFHGNDAKFVYYLLSSFDFKKFSDKTGVPGVNRNDLHAVKVGVPPIEEQLKIAKSLGIMEKQIDSIVTKLFLLKQEKKALMQQLLTGKRRVKVDD